METIDDIVREMREGHPPCNYYNENGEPFDFEEMVTMFAGRIESALKRERAQHAAVLREQIDEVQKCAVYKEALKPVLECDSTVGESMHAVVEALRIWREGMEAIND